MPPRQDHDDVPEKRCSTGIAGFDDVLHGGLPEHRLYLVEGTPGVGKTTLALQFLREGVKSGERALYFNLSESRAELIEVARAHGWSLDGINLYDLSAATKALPFNDENTLYAPADVELKETVGTLLAEADRVQPARVVFDSLSEIRLLAQTPIRFRRQMLAIKQHFIDKACTTLLLDDRTAEPGDINLASLAHGVISLEQTPSPYGVDRRRFRVAKLRGSDFRSGFHDFTIERGGIVAFPRLIAAEHRTRLEASDLPSGIPELDTLLGGGLGRATSTLIMGASGCGKSALATQFACAAAARGERAAMFLFEERIGTLLRRAENLGMPLRQHVDAGKITLRQIDPAELAPDEFTNLVRVAVEEGATVTVIDSINGYYTAMPEARYLTLQMHELLGFLSERGVASILTLAQTGLAGNMRSPVDLSYLSDTIVLLRYFEAAGELRKVISVVKKRSGPHELALRELHLGESGVVIGAPLGHMHGVLTGVPQIIDATGRGASD